MILPISRSPLAEMVPTWAISSLEVTFFDLRLELLDDRGDSLLDAALEIHRIGAGRDRLGAFAHDRLGQHGGGGGAVAGHVGGLGGDLAHHLRAHVLELVFELDLLGDGHAVLGHARRAKGLSRARRCGPWAQRHLDGVGEDIDAAQHALPGVLRELHFFSCHDWLLQRVHRDCRFARSAPAQGKTPVVQLLSLVFPHPRASARVEKLILGTRPRIKAERAAIRPRRAPILFPR